MWLVFRSFATTPSCALWVMPQFLSKWKVSWRYIILVSLISMVLVIAKLWIFKCYCRNRKVDFRVLLGGFWGVTPPNTVRFFWNLDQSCSAKQSIICNSVFYIVLKIPGNGTEKQFFGFFSEVFLTIPSYALWFMPQFSGKWKVSWWYIMVINFIRIAFVVPKLWILKCFCGNAAALKWVFLGGFLALSPPNLTWIC